MMTADTTVHNPRALLSLSERLSHHLTPSTFTCQSSLWLAAALPEPKAQNPANEIIMAQGTR
jgi:hypothetical protein